jgi:uncharacterized protein HemX
MSKKKTTSKKKTGQAKATTEDATFESVEDQPVASETLEKDSASAETASTEPSVQAPTPDVSPGKSGGGFIAWLALIAAILALVAFGVDFVGDRGAAGESREDDPH